MAVDLTREEVSHGKSVVRLQVGALVDRRNWRLELRVRDAAGVREDRSGDTMREFTVDWDLLGSAVDAVQSLGELWCEVVLIGNEHDTIAPLVAALFVITELVHLAV